MKNSNNESPRTDCSPRHAADPSKEFFSAEEQQEGSPRECPECEGNGDFYVSRGIHLYAIPCKNCEGNGHVATK